MPFLQCIEIEHCLSKSRWGLNIYFFLHDVEKLKLNLLFSLTFSLQQNDRLHHKIHLVHSMGVLPLPHLELLVIIPTTKAKIIKILLKILVLCHLRKIFSNGYDYKKYIIEYRIAKKRKIIQNFT